MAEKKPFWKTKAPAKVKKKKLTPEQKKAAKARSNFSLLNL